MRSRRLPALAATLLISLASLAFGSVASATEPVSLDADRVVDQAGVLTDADEARVNDHLEALSSEADLDLWVVYVDEFTSPASAEEWANETAKQGNLGPDQYLLAIATEGRAYYLSADSSGPISEAAITAIERDDIEPRLGADDWAGAAIGAADGLADARNGGGASGWWIIVLVVAVIGALVIWALVRKRRRSGGAPAKTEVPLEELERRAASALVQTDDALTASQQELGFAAAEFGEEATAEFAQAIADARTALDSAFTLQQRLEDGTPDGPEQQRAWLGEIIALCERADDTLDAKAEAFDSLRDLAKNAPAALATVTAAHTAALAEVDAAAARVTELSAQYAPSALATVADNPAQARDRLDFAATQLAAAQQALTSNDGAAAAVSIRAAEQAVDQARTLEVAVDTLGGDLAAAEQHGAALLADLEADLAAAAATPDPDGRIAPIVASTRQQVETARAALTGTARDPLTVVAALERANTAIDAALGGIRDAQARAERARSVLGQTILQAKAQVSAGEDFITARRGAVGAPARTRLAEAGAALVQATQLQQSDPEQSLALAQRASSLAAEAISLAQRDVGAFSGGGSGGGGGDIGGMLGGIVLGSLLNSGGGFGGGFGGSRSRSSGFGGSRSSGSRSGGARRSSGGSRSRRGGGRF
ncbi:TPM domain-containing protein [Microbacterium dauci]|uniref:TPM domain-containing protein n=1 Tax=Microbacterium dauci TaxID=3048008 RepID=A0ABT6ZA24_9MICO|nr:TPM domain-containing protein [Microbacterium sp. LX3-4]MDJ1113013.1 TPM domain-containing protein [Microbacterium sp. LX3-4]